jgi:hypothetical protein
MPLHNSISGHYPQGDAASDPFVHSLPGELTPTLSLPGLADLLIALEPELLALPGPIPVLSNTLRELLVEVVS